MRLERQGNALKRQREFFTRQDNAPGHQELSLNVQGEFLMAEEEFLGFFAVCWCFFLSCHVAASEHCGGKGNTLQISYLSKMQHHEFEPPEALCDTISCFWYTSIEFGEKQSVFEVVPDGHAEIIFHFGSPCSISANGNLQTLPSPFMMGLLNQPVLLHSVNRLEIIGIRCFPWTVFDLLGLPSGKDEVRIFEHPVVHLQSKLAESINAGKIEEAVATVKQYFLMHARKLLLTVCYLKRALP